MVGLCCRVVAVGSSRLLGGADPMPGPGGGDCWRWVEGHRAMLTVGSIEAVAVALTIAHGVIPPTAGLRDGAPGLTELRPPSGQGPGAGQILRCFRSRVKVPR